MLLRACRSPGAGQADPWLSVDRVKKAEIGKEYEVHENKVEFENVAVNWMHTHAYAGITYSQLWNFAWIDYLE
jgi:hypothetical protein